MREHQRFSLAPIAKNQWTSLRAPGRRGPSGAVLFVLVTVPLALGAIAGWLFAPIASDGSAIPNPLTPVMALLGALTGAFLAAFVLLMNLRIKLAEPEGLANSVKQKRLVSETATTSLYLTLVSALAIILALITSIAWPQLAASAPFALRVLLGLIVAAITHLLIVGATVVRRVYGAYVGLFGSDLRSDLHPVPDERRRAG